MPQAKYKSVKLIGSMGLHFVPFSFTRQIVFLKVLRIRKRQGRAKEAYTTGFPAAIRRLTYMRSPTAPETVFPQFSKNQAAGLPETGCRKA